MVFPAAYHALVRRGAVQPGETVLVAQGGAPGGVGSAAVQIAAALGARVVGTVSGAEAGAGPQPRRRGDTIDYIRPGRRRSRPRAHDGKGFDLVRELVISVNLPVDVKLVAKGGRIVCTGQGPGAEATVPIGEALAKDASLLFMNLNNAGRAGVAGGSPQRSAPWPRPASCGRSSVRRSARGGPQGARAARRQASRQDRARAVTRRGAPERRVRR